MKIDYTHAEKICTAAEFSLLDQCKPKTLMKFSEPELNLKIKQAQQLVDKRKKGGAEPDKEVKALFSEALERLETRLTRKKREEGTLNGREKRPRGFPKAGEIPEESPALSLKQRAKQSGRLTDQRIAKSGLDSRVKGHVGARGRRNEAARDARNS